ncbi:presqualene diphosphate synthase HpnD [Caenispirillum salinarum]|uniref:presqualene diphosphate synthase HpnD n=1 Tax=Caenispirillum salinarum TaxID=859058 RepID=UPI003850F657
MTPPTTATAAPDPAQPPGRESEPLSPHDASALTRQLAAGSSFYWAMRVLPGRRQDAIFAVYAFCREVDDIADSHELTRDQKIAGLAEWRARVDALYGEGTVAPFPLEVPLRAAIGRYDMGKADFLAIIEGMEMDARGPVRAPSLATFDHYCDCVASAVGRLAVKSFGCPDGPGRRLADHLGRALQITNILRDIAEDAEDGRLYLPRELLERHGIGCDDPKVVAADPHLPGVCRDLAGMARDHFAKASAAAAECPRRTVRPALVMGAVYEATLNRLIARDWRDPTRRVRLSTPHKLWLMVRHGLL